MKYRIIFMRGGATVGVAVSLICIPQFFTPQAHSVLAHAGTVYMAKPGPAEAGAVLRPPILLVHSDGSEFQLPVRGPIAASFGANGNDGISFAIPLGTPVKAVQSGLVAYAGDELKGYGKLVLIRHERGFSSSYAHNSEVIVKRGDYVVRGQTIAISGATGNVSFPQLRFELRIEANPVDPLIYIRY